MLNILLLKNLFNSFCKIQYECGTKLNRKCWCVSRCWKWVLAIWRETCSLFTCCWPTVTSTCCGKVIVHVVCKVSHSFCSSAENLLWLNFASLCRCSREALHCRRSRVLQRTGLSLCKFLRTALCDPFVYTLLLPGRTKWLASIANMSSPCRWASTSRQWRWFAPTDGGSSC